MKKLTQKEWIAVIVGLVIVILFFYLFIPFQFLNNDLATSTQQNGKTGVVSDIVTESGLIIKDVTLGTGSVAVRGKTVVVHYVGTLEDGTQFDSSVGRGQPFSFLLGAGQVIQGWEQGFEGMKVGGRRVLTIPPELGYGPNAVGSIPANSTLIFEVTLLDVVDASASE